MAPIRLYTSGSAAPIIHAARTTVTVTVSFVRPVSLRSLAGLPEIKLGHYLFSHKLVYCSLSDPNCECCSHLNTFISQLYCICAGRSTRPHRA